MLIFVLSQCLPVAHQIPFCHISIGGGDNLLPGSAAVWGGPWALESDSLSWLPGVTGQTLTTFFHSPTKP